MIQENRGYNLRRAKEIYAKEKSTKAVLAFFEEEGVSKDRQKIMMDIVYKHARSQEPPASEFTGKTIFWLIIAAIVAVISVLRLINKLDEFF